jgi:F0F1-type ATP synthase, delta subunit (mitochondrial oligomycin sensitivity protein)
VIAPIELSPEDVEEVKRVLREKFGKEVYLDLRVDPSIIGGLMIKIGDCV